LQKNNIQIYTILNPFVLISTEYNFKREIFKNIKKISLLYDFIPLIYKKGYLNSKIFLNGYNSMVRKLKNMDHLLAISATTKIDAIKLGFKPNKITVISCGVESCFRKNKCNILELEKFGISKKYILSVVGPGDYRKNVPTLIKSFKNLNNFIKEKYQLVIVGGLEFFNTKEYLNDKDFKEKKIIFTKEVTKEDLIKLYNCAELFVFIPLYEGFGIPVLEALACCKTVITSNTSALNEFPSEIVYKVNPKNIEEISENISKILLNPLLKIKNIPKGLEYAKNFTWEKVSKKITDVYNHLL